MNSAVAIDEKPVKRTRKDHRCCECQNIIPVGSACMTVRGIWEDGPMVLYWCLYCDLLRRDVMELIDHRREPICYGELWDLIRDIY